MPQSVPWRHFACRILLRRLQPGQYQFERRIAFVQPFRDLAGSQRLRVHAQPLFVIRPNGGYSRNTPLDEQKLLFHFVVLEGVDHVLFLQVKNPLRQLRRKLNAFQPHGIRHFSMPVKNTREA